MDPNPPETKNENEFCNKIVEDVMAKVWLPLKNAGVEENVLNQLQTAWINNLMAQNQLKLLEEVPKPKEQNLTEADMCIDDADIIINQFEVMDDVFNNHRPTSETEELQDYPTLVFKTDVPADLGAQIKKFRYPLCYGVPDERQSSYQLGYEAGPATLSIHFLHPNAVIPVGVKLESLTAKPRNITIYVPASALQTGQLEKILHNKFMESVMTLPLDIAIIVIQQEIDACLKRKFKPGKNIHQLDGILDVTEHELMLFGDAVEKLDNIEILDSPNYFLDPPKPQKKIKNTGPKKNDVNVPCQDDIFGPLNVHYEDEDVEEEEEEEEKEEEKDADIDADDEDEEDDEGDKNDDDDESDTEEELYNGNNSGSYVENIDSNTTIFNEDEDDDSDAVFSDDEDDDDDDDLKYVESDDSNDGAAEIETEVESLNSNDDSDGSSDVFETDNIIVCQFDRITRKNNEWKFILKDGIMKINGKDYLFHKLTGTADW